MEHQALTPDFLGWRQGCTWIGAYTLNNGLVFIKWLKRDTGETLLFTVKEITASSADNWVSFIPDNGWAPGEYEVRYYRFQSNLEPLAVNRYTIIDIQPNN